MPTHPPAHPASVMLDIETLGTSPGCAITEIAAVIFCDDTFHTTAQYHRHINITSNNILGLTTCPKTTAWRKKHTSWNPDAPGVNIHDAITGLIDFLHTHQPTKYWSKGITFDFPIIEHAAHSLQLPLPWKYWQLHDMRTIWNLAFPNKKTPPAPHCALQDCHNQIEQLRLANNHILRQKTAPIICEYVDKNRIIREKTFPPHHPAIPIEHNQND